MNTSSDIGPYPTVDNVLWCAECQTAIANTTTAYLKHSIATHKGGGWHGYEVPADTVPQQKATS